MGLMQAHYVAHGVDFNIADCEIQMNKVLF